MSLCVTKLIKCVTKMTKVNQIPQNYMWQQCLNDYLSFSSTLFLQSVTATRWVLFMIGVTVQASASVKMAPQGPSVMTVCQASTGNKAVTVSMMRLTFDGFRSITPWLKKGCSLLRPLQIYCAT